MPAPAPGTSQLLRHDGQEVALFNVEGRLYAVANRCPHRGGPLVRGRVETVSGTGTVPDTVAVRCPIHGWLFDLATGRCLNQPAAVIAAYAVACPAGEPCVTPAPPPVE